MTRTLFTEICHQLQVLSLGLKASNKELRLLMTNFKVSQKLSQKEKNSKMPKNFSTP